MSCRSCREGQDFFYGSRACRGDVVRRKPSAVNQRGRMTTRTDDACSRLPSASAVSSWLLSREGSVRMSSSCVPQVRIKVSVGGRSSSPTETHHGYRYRTPAAPLREDALAAHETTTWQCGQPPPRPHHLAVARPGPQSRDRGPRRLHTPVGALDHPPLQRRRPLGHPLVSGLASQLPPTR